ncbi:hypothetical protein FB567DRAFT_285628 [Paraphoma chrysanthemicola]|uniref:Uncharacterized protein n=1 Tax=Paraphoma chrysanthemicola TaxID=798071 RepID=A0A8K0R8I6_9PLEO|nr:hypothetical protein FB567DRAFT_285628 [Paraphoma chrysanthemicola]
MVRQHQIRYRSRYPQYDITSECVLHFNHARSPSPIARLKGSSRKAEGGQRDTTAATIKDQFITSVITMNWQLNLLPIWALTQTVSPDAAKKYSSAPAAVEPNCVSRPRRTRGLSHPKAMCPILHSQAPASSHERCLPEHKHAVVTPVLSMNMSDTPRRGAFLRTRRAIPPDPAWHAGTPHFVLQALPHFAAMRPPSTSRPSHAIMIMLKVIVA